jgi:Homeodomain-like domain
VLASPCGWPSHPADDLSAGREPPARSATGRGLLLVGSRNVLFFTRLLPSASTNGWMDQSQRAHGSPIAVRPDYTAGEVRRFAKRAKDAAQARRLLAIAAVLDGASREDAAKIGGMDRQTLRDWVIRFNQQGPGGLGAQVRCGWIRGARPGRRFYSPLQSHPHRRWFKGGRSHIRKTLRACYHSPGHNALRRTL